MNTAYIDEGFLIPLLPVIEIQIMMKYTAVFIDFDDTLIDTAQNTYDTVNDIYNDYDLDRYFNSFEDYFSNYFFPNTMEIWHKYEREEITKDELIRQRFLNTFSHLPEMSAKQALEINKDYLGRIVKASTLIPGAIELLDYLREKYPVFMVSNGFADMQYTKIDSAGLNGYFDGVILSDEVGSSKPNPRIYEEALNKAGETSERVIMIGDNYVTDITGARNAGIDQIWLNLKGKSIPNFEPTYSVKALDEIKGIL